jgi:dolichol-phosphate mannosyltransferase
MKLSILTPAFNEAENLPALHTRLVAAMSALGVAWEWLVVDDHSRDPTFDVVRALATRDPRVRGIRFARNAGSHAAIACGLHHVDGDAVVMMAAHLQDPPETIGQMLERWRDGAKVVWAVRREQPGGTSHAGLAAVYYWVMRRVVGLSEMPARGADFFLADRVVVDAFRRFPERNVSVFALLTWIGFRQDQVEYEKQPRAAGRSGWTLARKIKLVVDSVTAFSDLPIRLSLYAGLLLLAASAVLGVAALSVRGGRIVPIGLLAAMTGLAGLQLTALGWVGQYVWRAFDEARRRPAYVVEALAGVDALAGESTRPTG